MAQLSASLLIILGASRNRLGRAVAPYRSASSARTRAGKGEEEPSATAICREQLLKPFDDLSKSRKLIGDACSTSYSALQ